MSKPFTLGPWKVAALQADDRIRCLRCGLEMDPRLWRSCTKGGSCYWRVTEAALPRDFMKFYNERNAKAAELFAKLPGFDIEAALAGAPYVHRFDLPKVHPYHDVRRIAEPHGGLLVWVGEWVTYDSTDSGLEELESQLAMYDATVLGAE